MKNSIMDCVYCSHSEWDGSWSLAARVCHHPSMRKHHKCPSFRCNLDSLPNPGFQLECPWYLDEKESEDK